jgi:hypothetical protein
MCEAWRHFWERVPGEGGLSQLPFGKFSRLSFDGFGLSFDG